MDRTVRGKRVLVTGAGGWLGGEMAARLTAEGAEVTALMRRAGDVLGNDGAVAPVARVVLGDLAVPRLGWDVERWRREAAGHELIVHCAALTRFDAAPALAHAANVAGTAEVVALAAAGGAGLLHVSTAYVNGTRDGVVLETAPLGTAFNNTYEHSKAQAELVVRGAGIAAVIARPSIVLGDHAAGRVRSFGTFYYLLKILAEGRVRQMPAEAWATLDMVPVDYVIDGLVALIRAFDRAAGQTVHLVGSAPTPMSAFTATLSRFQGLAVPEFVAPADFVVPPGRAFGRLIAPYAPYFSRNPRFDDRGFRALTGMACPSTGAAWWERLVSFAVEAGFVSQASRMRPKGRASEDRTPSSAGSR